MSKSVREQVMDLSPEAGELIELYERVKALRFAVSHKVETAEAELESCACDIHGAFQAKAMLSEAHEALAAECRALQSEVARLRGVIEGTAKWMDREAEEWRELRFFGNGIACRNEASRLRAALSPQPGPRDSIRLQCPRCGTTTTAARRDWDPVHAVLCCVYCPDCVSGGFGEYVTYYDAKGSEITDPPGGSDVLDM